ncbi:hypothetical protein, partial [Alkanindiges hydrocarboniclasticus]|uniref:hypothetical protein n=1 Tax=Alkanindiges hydrocarboniclasticus TaxID=1907941 RepID=UPI00117893EA
MKIKTLNTYGLLFGFLFLFNIVAGGIIPLGIEPLKDSIKMIIFFVDVFALFILKTRSKDFMVTIYYFLVVGIILFISLYGSVEINYALEKVDAILWCVPLSTLLLLGMHRRFGLINTLDI